MIKSISSLVNYLLTYLGLRVVKVSKPDSRVKPRWANNLKFPNDHPLPEILGLFPNYQTNLANIAELVSLKYPEAGVVDVGANIGDTAALIRSVSNQPIVCVEPDSLYYKYLESNSSTMNDITLCKCLLSDSCGIASDNYKVEHGNGTMRLIPGGENKITASTLDELISDLGVSYPIKLIKVDTDGFDLKILRGGIVYIKSEMPVLFFEYDPSYLVTSDLQYKETIQKLFHLGYQFVVIYDHLGRLLLWDNKSVVELVDQIDQYLRYEKRLLAYVDVCFISNQDADVYEKLIESRIDI
ncbi:FkbM family methyltransferase [Pseudomonadota bacterium]